MGAKCILRVQKLKSAQSVKRSLMHGFREQETPNADPSKSSLNFFVGAQNATEAYQRFKSCLPEKKQRRDAVQCLEFLFTGSPEWFTENPESRHKQFFSDSLDWLKSKFGAKNVFLLAYIETKPRRTCTPMSSPRTRRQAISAPPNGLAMLGR